MNQLNVLYVQEVVNHYIYVTVYIEWVTTSWTDGSIFQFRSRTASLKTKQKRIFILFYYSFATWTNFTIKYLWLDQTIFLEIATPSFEFLLLLPVIKYFSKLYIFFHWLKQVHDNVWSRDSNNFFLLLKRN